MHARAGVLDGVLNHTISGSDIFELRFNGTPVGETGINAALCGTFECPVVLVTGDDAVCREGRELLGEGLTTVAVKQGLGRNSARNIAPQRAREMIEDGAERALADLSAVAPYDPGHPCEIEVDLMGSHLVEPYRFRHGIEVWTGAASSRRPMTGGRPGGSSGRCRDRRGRHPRSCSVVEEPELQHVA